MEKSQKLQNKTTLKVCDDKADIAGAMGALSGQMIPESEDYHEFIRNISIPRDEEYVQLIARQIEVLNRKEELLAELEELKEEQEKLPGKEAETEAFENRAAVVNPEISRSGHTNNQKQVNVEQKVVQDARKQQTPSKEEVRKKEIEAELKRLDEEAAFLKKNLEDMFPESRRMQCMIYPSFRAGELIRAGVIRDRGWGYEGGEELCARVKPDTTRERGMLILGDSILQKELYQVLNIEIYPEAVCVVYPNGLTKVYR